MRSALLQGSYATAMDYDLRRTIIALAVIAALAGLMLSVVRGDPNGPLMARPTN